MTRRLAISSHILASQSSYDYWVPWDTPSASAQTGGTPDSIRLLRVAEPAPDAGFVFAKFYNRVTWISLPS